MKDIKQLVDKETLWIAEELIRSSIEDEFGVHWKTLHRQPYGKLYEQSNEQIYNGTAGICLFFISFYNYSKNNKYLEIAEKGTLWCKHYIANNAKPYYTFYTGAVGIIYLYVKLYESTGDRNHLEIAGDLLKTLEPGIINEVKLDDLLSGNAGNLFVITSLYVHTDNPQQYKLIKLLISRLIANARISQSGLKWGHLNNALDSCIGMSHGACGIAHVLLEVAKTLKYPQLNWLAEKALAFEDQYFSSVASTWVDMRIYDDHISSENIIEEGLSFYLKNSKGINAWAHGTAGLGLARLNAFMLLKKQKYSRKGKQAVNVALADMRELKSVSNLTISSGMGSWIELCITAARIFKNSKLTILANTFLEKGLSFKASAGYYGSAWYADKADPALMVGTAGIGQLYIQILHEGANSILLPKIKVTRSKSFAGKIALAQIKRRIYQKYFKRTSWVLTSYKLDYSSIFNENQNNELITDISDAFESLISGLPKKQRWRAEDVFRLEKAAVMLAITPDYNIYREQKHDFFKNQISDSENWTDEDLDHKVFVRSRHVKIVENKWLWPLNQKNQYVNNKTMTPGLHPAILRLEIDHLAEFWPNKFSAELLKVMEKPLNLSDIVAILKKQLDQEEGSLKILVRQQIKIFVKQWFVEEKK